MNTQIIDPMHSAFAGFTNAEAMRGLLADPVRTLWDDAHHIVECEVAHAWRKTYGRTASWHKSHLRVCYRLRLMRHGTRDSFAAWVHGTARLDDVDDDGSTGSSPRAAVTLGAATLRLRRFPDDPGLPQLAQLVDPDTAGARLTRLFSGEPCGDASVTVLRYRPGERCAVRVASVHASAFAKTYRGNAGERAHFRLSRLFTEGRKAGRRFAVAEPLGYDEATGTVWQRWVEGGTAADAACEPGFTDRVRQCAQALAGLHAVTLEDLAVQERVRLLYETRKRVVKLALAFPSAAESLQRVIDRLLRAIDTLPPMTPTVVHGDIHLEQFLLQGDGVALADVDEIGLGDAEQDVAALMLDLHLRASEAGTTAPWPEMASDAYADRAAAPISHPLFVWHLARQCIDKAYRLHWRNASGLAPVVVNLLGWADASSRELTGASS